MTLWIQSRQQIETILQQKQAVDVIFSELLAILCHVLICDRCFLYVRNPETGQGKITHCYSVSSHYADLTGVCWIEAADIADQDPLMAIAFQTPEAVFVDDIETADATLVNLTYEREQFGHRALIHAPIYAEGKLQAILEPCVFEKPRTWSEQDRAVISLIQEKLSPLVMQYKQETLLENLS
jgi:GAF domain-containing protein